MPQSKQNQPIYDAQSDLFRALGHPIRIRILELLLESDQSVAGLLAEIGVEPSTLSQHLAIMKRTGLVESSRKGNAVTYRLADTSIEQLIGAARNVLASTLGKSRLALEELERSGTQ